MDSHAMNMEQSSITDAEANGLCRLSSHYFEEKLCFLLEGVTLEAGLASVFDLIENPWDRYLLESTKIGEENSVTESIIEVNRIYTTSNAFIMSGRYDSDKYKSIRESLCCSATKLMIIPTFKRDVLECIVPDVSIFSTVVPESTFGNALLPADCSQDIVYDYPDIITEHSKIADSLWPNILVRAWKKRDEYAYPTDSSEAKGATAIFQLIKLSAPLQSCLGLVPVATFAEPASKRRRVDAGWWAYPISRMLAWSRSYGRP